MHQQNLPVILLLARWQHRLSTVYPRSVLPFDHRRRRIHGDNEFAFWKPLLGGPGNCTRVVMADAAASLSFGQSLGHQLINDHILLNCSRVGSIGYVGTLCANPY